MIYKDSLHISDQPASQGQTSSSSSSAFLVGSKKKKERKKEREKYLVRQQAREDLPVRRFSPGIFFRRFYTPKNILRQKL